MAEQPILVTKSAGIAQLVLNRPNVMNAINMDIKRRFIEAMNDLRDDKDVRVIVMSGAGGNFCSGGDLKEMRNPDIKKDRDYCRELASMLLTVTQTNKPVIASVEGVALGGGLGLVAVSDLAIAAEDAVFGLPEMAFNFFPVVQVMPVIRSVGKKRAFEMIFGAKKFSALEARDYGLVNRVVPRDRLAAVTMEVASGLAQVKPEAMQLGKYAIGHMSKLDFEAGMDYSMDLLWATIGEQQAKQPH